MAASIPLLHRAPRNSSPASLGESLDILYDNSHMMTGKHEGGADQIGKCNSSPASLGESLEERKHIDRNKEGVTCIFSPLLYGCGAWVVTRAIEQRIMAS